jgi:pyrroloquinoline quinone (PQQ) biosynthesis protein C
MQLDQFKLLVADMRHAQKEYFRTRSSSALDHAKRAEKAVDDALAKLDDKQSKLFED